MARKRLNTRFLIYTLSGIGLAGGLALIAYKNQKPRNPQVYIAAGDQNMQKQEYQKAIANYAAAADLLPQDLNLHLKLGRAYYELRTVSSDNFQSAVAEFTKAEEIKPDSKEAWEGLLQTNQYLVQAWETRPGDSRDREMLPQSINMARESAEHLVKLEPDNVEARAAGPILTLRVWLLNLTMPLSPSDTDRSGDPLTPDQLADRAVADLSKLMQEHPENEQIPYWIARAKVYQGQLALKTDHPENASPLFAEAASAFEPSIAAKPDVVGLYLNKSAILTLLQTADPDPQSWQQYSKANHEALQKAQAMVDPKNNQQYKLAKQQWAANLATTDPTSSERVFRDLIAKFPNELIYRVQLARLLQRQPDRRADALKLLGDISTLTPPAVTEFQQRQTWDNLVAYCRLERADIETDQLAVTPQGKAHDEMSAEIQKALDDSQAHYGGTSSLLKILGHFQLVNGQTRDAIVTLTQAADKMQVESGTVDYDLLRQEARAYRDGQQTGKAIDILEKASANGVTNPDLKNTLAELYIENQDYARAAPYVHWIAERFPDEPHTIILQIRDLGPAADWDAIKPLFDKLPEQTPDDVTLKFNIAMQVNNRDEAIRLKTITHQQNPADIQTTTALLQLLAAANRPDEAKKVLKDAMALAPNDSTLKLYDEALNHASNSKIEDDELALIQAMPDAFMREGRLAEFYRLKENPEEELKHLNAQLKLQPNNRQVLQTVFLRHLDAKRFADADAMIPHLTEIDADDAHGLMLKTKLALAKQDVPNALLSSRQMTHDFPDFAGSWEMYGEALRDSGQLDAACQQFNTALQLQATNMDASKNLIQCSVQQGKLADAKSYISDACKRFPNDPAYQDMRIQYEILYGNPESVVAELSDALQKHPTDPHSYGLLASAQLASMHAKSQLGQSDAANQYLQGARDTFQKAATQWPDNLRFANSLSQMYQQLGDQTNAENALKAIIARPHWKDQPAPLILLAKVYLSANKPEPAQATLHQALAADPGSIDAHLVLADSLILQQKYDDALAVLQPVASDFRVRVKYTDLLVALGRGPQAEVGLEEAIAQQPTNIALVNLLLHVYDAQGHYDRGIRAATDDIANNPQNIFAYFWRGKMQASGPSPDLDSAIKDLDFFRDAVPTSVDGRIALAQALDAKLDRDGAVRELEAALQFDSQNRQVRYQLLNEYLNSTPSRTIDADRLLSQTLAIPSLQHDPQFETAAALIWVKKGDNDKAVSTIQDAMQHTPNKSDLIHDYFEVLLQTKDPRNLQLLLDESQQYASDPKTRWFVFNDRGAAKAALDDTDGAESEFSTAMDRASGETGVQPAEEIAATIARAPKFGVDKTLQMVLPRAQNSVTWKQVALNLYIAKGDMAKGMATAEEALAVSDSLPAADQFRLYRQASELYLNAQPPMVDKAVALYQKMLAVHPDDVEALNDMACVYADMVTPSKPEEALTYSQRAFDAAQKHGRMDARVYDTQGWVLVLNNRVDDGIDIMHRSIDQADFPEAHYHLAVAYLQKQLPVEAQHELDTATSMIDAKTKDHQLVDPTLKDKIDNLTRKIDDAVGVKPPVKAAS
jgi:tetratricopeptide (TPR) repeat protein